MSASRDGLVELFEDFPMMRHIDFQPTIHSSAGHGIPHTISHSKTLATCAFEIFHSVHFA
ncbi:unnamed protein product [Rodentolepis nana]|uniref:Uncharacterized protein n=1 Tax=Rodentolepis nana TaxID=102285 RepID=A0A3P7V7Q6_RODNA|nr:unnamed protein product [Rodentolepis nana]